MSDLLEDELLDLDRDTVEAVCDKIMALDGSPMMRGTVVKTMRALIALGWNGWPEDE